MTKHCRQKEAQVQYYSTILAPCTLTFASPTGARAAPSPTSGALKWARARPVLQQNNAVKTAPCAPLQGGRMLIGIQNGFPNDEYLPTRWLHPCTGGGLAGTGAHCAAPPTCNSSLCTATARGRASPHRPSPEEPTGQGTMLPGRAEQGRRASPAKGAEALPVQALGPAALASQLRGPCSAWPSCASSSCRALPCGASSRPAACPKSCSGQLSSRCGCCWGAFWQRGQ